jgi:N-acetylglucosamine-6-sulfatase
MDLEADPQELRSFHDDPDYAQILAGMQKRYRDLRKFYEVNTAVIPATRGDESWWRERQLVANEQAQRVDVKLAFIGDSITQGWEGAGKVIWEERFAPRTSINLGFSGDRTEHVVWRLTHGNLENIRPQVAVVMIGTNNTGHLMQDPQEVAGGIHRILELIEERSPETKVLLLGVFPRGKTRYDVMRLNNVAINQIIRRYADGQRVHYLDASNAFLESDGTLSEQVMPDLLHLSPEGYRRWADAIEPKLRELGL